MNLQRLGTDYGGWTIDIDSVPDGSVVIDAGIGKDDSFSQELLKLRPNCTVIAIDPSADTRMHYSKNPCPSGMIFLPRALHTDNGTLVMFEGDKRSDAVVGSGMPGMTDRSYRVSTIQVRELIRWNPVSLVKLDIEGHEFLVLPQCVGVPQIAVEFHVIQMPHKEKLMSDCVNILQQSGYEIIHRTNRNELTFLKRS